MKPNIKKLLILNAPYLLFVYLFDKVGQAVRLSPGAGLSGKLLSIGSGFSAAFSNALPSFAPMDLLIGIVGAVVIRLAAFLRHKDGQAVFPAQPVADVAYSVIGALVGNILVVVYKVYRTKNDVVMDMPFIYVSGKDVFILPLCYRVGKLFSDFMGFLIIDFPRLKRLYQMVCEVVSSVKSLRQCKSELNICRFIAAPERGHQHFPVRLVRVLDIVKGFA